MVAMVILAIAATAVGRFVVSVQKGLRDRELSARIDWELTNARERIGSWPISEVRQEKIEALPISSFLQASLDQPGWRAEVKSISQPIDARQVTLQLQCVWQGQRATPACLTFWVVDEERQETGGESSVDSNAEDTPGGVGDV
jgi:hypothetical protein